jgi:hypothetical protein
VDIKANWRSGIWLLEIVDLGKEDRCVADPMDSQPEILENVEINC